MYMCIFFSFIADIVYDEFLLVADQRLRRLYQIDLWKVELNALPIFPLTQPIDVAFDYTEMMVGIIIDLFLLEIKEVHLKTKLQDSL